MSNFVLSFSISFVHIFMATPQALGQSYDMWDEITYPFINFNGCTIEV